MTDEDRHEVEIMRKLDNKEHLIIWACVRLELCQSSSPVAVVHCISKPRCINYGECQLDASFLDQDFGLLHLKNTTFTFLATELKQYFRLTSEFLLSC